MGSDHDDEHHDEDKGDPRQGWIFSRASKGLNINEEVWEKMKSDEDRNDRFDPKPDPHRSLYEASESKFVAIVIIVSQSVATHLNNCGTLLYKWVQAAISSFFLKNRRLVLHDFINTDLQCIFITLESKDKVRVIGDSAPKAGKKVLFYAKVASMSPNRPYPLSLQGHCC